MPHSIFSVPLPARSTRATARRARSRQATHAAGIAAALALLTAAGPFAVAAPLAAQAPRATDITLAPARPSQGRLVEVRVAGPASAGAPAGTLAGEPLHFERRGDRWWALGALAVDAPDTVTLVVRRGADSTVRRVAVAKGDYPLEKLTVAPRYGTEPDSALTARMDAETARAMAVGRASHERARLWRGTFARPRPGRVTSRFGRGREYNGTVQGRHMGTDFAGATGTPVRATNRGVVALVDTFFLGGRVVYVDHGAGLVSAYMHLSRASVAVGDTVARGQVIGRVGATGRVTGPHLHWAVRYGTTTVDPLSLPGLAPAPRPARPATRASSRKPTTRTSSSVKRTTR